MASLEPMLGSCVCAALDELDVMLSKVLHETRLMCRTQYRGTTQLQTSCQRVQSLMQECLLRHARLSHYLEKVRETQNVVARIKSTETAITVSKQEVFTKLGLNAKQERKVRDLVRKVRTKEKEYLVHAQRSNHKIVYNTAEDSLICKTKTNNPANFDSFAHTQKAGNAGVSLSKILAYAKRIGRATSLQPFQETNVYPEETEFKNSILHRPKLFSVEQYVNSSASTNSKATKAVEMTETGTNQKSSTTISASNQGIMPGSPSVAQAQTSFDEV